MPMFGVICKKLRFSRQFMKLIVKLYLVLHAGPIETQNQDLRPLPDLFRHHESNVSLRFGK